MPVEGSKPFASSDPSRILILARGTTNQEATMIRTPSNRVKSYTGTVHYANAGRPSCGPVRTASEYLNPTIEDVTCQRCIAQFGADEVTGLRDPAPVADENVARRAAERRIRQAARS